MLPKYPCPTPSSEYPLHHIIQWPQAPVPRSSARDPALGPREEAAAGQPRSQWQPGQPAAVSPPPHQHSRLWQGETTGNFGDSSGPIFSMYSKAAEEEDKNMADRWQKDADGILIFTGLFSAAVAALLAVTVPLLTPNSQDTSAFYLGNIYELLADPNATHTSIPSPIDKAHSFSPPRYAIWVNSLWFLSLVISLTCALLATSSHQWARRYIRVTQPARCSPEKRARMRAFYANGVEKMYITPVVEGLPTLIHLSLFLFFGGLVIFLYNTNPAVFYSVVWWIVFFSTTYGLITVMPVFRHDSPYFTPLSLPAWFLYASISHLFFKTIFSIRSNKITVFRSWERLRALRNRYRGWILGGVEKAAEETASEQLSEIYAHILRWTIDDLGDDDRMTKFFAAIPGFFNSKLVEKLKGNLPDSLLKKFWKALHGFFDRTLSSNSAIEFVKDPRLDLGMNAMSTIAIPGVSSIPNDLLFGPWDQAPQRVDLVYTMETWCASRHDDIAQYARCIATRILAAASMQQRDDCWIDLATRVLGLSEDKVRHYIAHGNDSVFLAILISVARRHIHSDFYDWGLLSTLYRLNIHNTLPELQDAFCELWNDCVEEARRRPPDTFPVGILRLTRFLYIDLHKDSPAAPTLFSAQTEDFDHILFRPESYPSCDTQDHRPIHFPIPVIPTLAPVGGSGPGGVAVAPQDLTIATLPHPLEGNMRQDIVTPWQISNIDRRLFTAPTFLVAPTSAVPVINNMLASHSAGFDTTSESIPTSQSSQIPPLPNKEPFSLSTSHSGPSNTTTLPCLRPRGLINEGNMSFANVVLQLLVYCPQFWNQLRHMSRLIGRHGEPKGQQTGGAGTVLIDATFRLLDEFVHKERTSLTQGPLQLVQKGKAREDEKYDNNMDSFIPRYVYDAIKEKKQFKDMLNGGKQDAEEFFWAYLDVLDEEFSALFTPSTHKPLACVVLGEGSQSDEGHWQTEAGKWDHIPPISCIFEGTFRTTARRAGQPDAVTIEGRRSLQLDIEPSSVQSVQDALAHIVRRPEVGSSGPSRQVTVILEALPPVLVFHLKRFSRDAATGGVVKNNKHILLTSVLEIPPDIIAPGAGQPACPARYSLCGVIYHHGESAGGSHYTVDVLHPNPHDDGEGEVWLNIDDETVSTLRDEDVVERLDNGRVDGRYAHLLLYRRITSS